jgi:hypothetical protein
MPESIYPQALLDAMAANSASRSVERVAKGDVEVIARNLSSVEDALFYLKTTSEIVRKWPADRARIFLQDLLKQAMERDNEMRAKNEEAL